MTQNGTQIQKREVRQARKKRKKGIEQKRWSEWKARKTRKKWNEPELQTKIEKKNRKKKGK